MDVYSCRIRPSGFLMHEVNRQGITAAEVVLLRAIHGGPETVIVLKKTGNADPSPAEEYERLAEYYGADQVRAVYGPVTSARLPDRVDDDFEDETEKAEPKAKEKAPAKKGRGKKAAQVEPDDEDELDNFDDE